MRKIVALLVALLGFCSALRADDRPGPFIYRDGLVARDSWGRLHQMPTVNSTDFAPRYAVRFHYYFKGQRTLTRDVAYVAAVQRDLRLRIGRIAANRVSLY